MGETHCRACPSPTDALVMNMWVAAGCPRTVYTARMMVMAALETCGALPGLLICSLRAGRRAVADA